MQAHRDSTVGELPSAGTVTARDALIDAATATLRFHVPDPFGVCDGCISAWSRWVPYAGCTQVEWALRTLETYGAIAPIGFVPQVLSELSATDVGDQDGERAEQRSGPTADAPGEFVLPAPDADFSSRTDPACPLAATLAQRARRHTSQGLADDSA